MQKKVEEVNLGVGVRFDIYKNEINSSSGRAIRLKSFLLKFLVYIFLLLSFSAVILNFSNKDLALKKVNSTIASTT